jgi:hypothetical protein
MDPTTMSVTERGAWNALLAHYQKVRDFDLRKFFTKWSHTRRAYDAGTNVERRLGS